MKKLLFSILLACGAVIVNAQRIAVVDIAAVLEGMADYKAAQAEIDKVAAQWQQEVAQEFDKIREWINE